MDKYVDAEKTPFEKLSQKEQNVIIFDIRKKLNISQEDAIKKAKEMEYLKETTIYYQI